MSSASKASCPKTHTESVAPPSRPGPLKGSLSISVGMRRFFPSCAEAEDPSSVEPERVGRRLSYLISPRTRRLLRRLSGDRALDPSVHKVLIFLSNFCASSTAFKILLSFYSSSSLLLCTSAPLGEAVLLRGKLLPGSKSFSRLFRPLALGPRSSKSLPYCRLAVNHVTVAESCVLRRAGVCVTLQHCPEISYAGNWLLPEPETLPGSHQLHGTGDLGSLPVNPAGTVVAESGVTPARPTVSSQALQQLFPAQQ